MALGPLATWYYCGLRCRLGGRVGLLGCLVQWIYRRLDVLALGWG